MKFYSSEDIEHLASQGQKELILDGTIALTDLARDVARQLGITLIDKTRATAPSKPPASSSETRAPAAPLPAKPRGCQHGPLTGPGPAPTAASSGSSPIVDRLVGMVKQIAKRPGS